MSAAESNKLMTTFTNAEKATEAAREVKMRKEVYARIGMDAAKQRRIAIMQEIAAEYSKAAEGDRLI